MTVIELKQLLGLALCAAVFMAGCGLVAAMTLKWPPGWFDWMH